MLTGCSKKEDDHVSLEIWHYYNGTQKVAFDQLVEEFNLTVGFEKNIIVEAFGQGNINQLEERLIQAAENKVGASKTPNIITTYSEIAYALDQKGMLTNLEAYLTDNEMDEYIDSYIEEGRLGENNQFKIFPTAKATEILMLNKTDWNKFSRATKVRTDALTTWEGLRKTSEMYYNWTDSLTTEKNDGKAFFGRDALANYMLIGSKQLGKEIFLVENDKVTVQIDSDIMRRLWDNYYIPYISGYYTSYGKFSTDDAKTGEIIALVGSTTGVTYFPQNVTLRNEECYDIELLVLPLPNFKNTSFDAVQQGAGMAVIKSNEAQEKASVEFLKWFTEDSRNLDFSKNTGYLPVKKVTYDIFLPSKLGNSTSIAMEQTKKYNLVYSKGFKNGGKAREILEKSMQEKAKADRQKVIELMAQGIRHKDAVAQFSTDRNFNMWLTEFQESLVGAVNQ